MKHLQMFNLKEKLHDREGHILVKHVKHNSLQFPKWKALETQVILFDQSVEVRSL
jgi:hypothetical protein